MAKYTIKNEKNKNSKNKKKNLLKEQRDVNDNELEIKHFFIILAIVIVIALGLYFISEVIVNKRGDNTVKATEDGKINYDVVSVGTILNRPYNDYYVLVYNSEDTNAIYYSNLYGKYSSKEDGLKIYYCDLNNSLNSSYVAEDEEGNPYATTTEEFSFGKITLLRVSYGRVVSYMNDLEEIANTLNN